MNIGALIRKRRKEMKLTLKVVAERAAISEGFLSQVENDVNSPSVDTLVRICDALGVSAGDVLTQASQKQKSVVIRRSDWEEIELSHTGFATRRFFPPEDRKVIDTSILVIEPGTHIPVRQGIKNGQEVLTVLIGAVELVVSDAVYQMSEGDSVHFWSDPAHQKITNKGEERSIILWVGTL